MEEILAPISSYMGSGIVTIFVGKKRKEFQIHKSLICETSKYFRDAFSGAFREGKENTMHMPEDDPEAFSCFIDWLYRSPLPIVKDTYEAPKKSTEMMNGSQYFGPPTEEEHLQKLEQTKKEADEQKKAQHIRLGKQFSRLLSLYFFAEKLFLNELMNLTMDRIRQGLRTYHRFFKKQEIKLVYMNTSQGSKLRTFCAELLVFQLATATDKKINSLVALTQEIPDLCRDFMKEFQSLSSWRVDMSDEMDEPWCDADPRFRGLDPESEESVCCFHNHDDSDTRGLCQSLRDSLHGEMWGNGCGALHCVHCC